MITGLDLYIPEEKQGGSDTNVTGKTVDLEGTSVLLKSMSNVVLF